MREMSFDAMRLQGRAAAQIGASELLPIGGLSSSFSEAFTS
jgi:hypothetical protein